MNIEKLRACVAALNWTTATRASRLCVSAVTAGVMTCALVAGTTRARAADWPTRQVSVIVPYAPGGFTDLLARISAKYLSEKFGQTFVVENRVGAAGAIASTIVTNAPPDGYTLMFGSVSQTATVPLIQKVNYDPEALVPVSVFGQIPFLMGIKSSLPVKTVAEFVAYAKAHPGKLNYATAGVGATSHLISAGFTERAGINMVHVPYKGSAPATAALLQGEVDMTWSGVSDMAAQLSNDKIRVIATSSKDRLVTLPNIPTIGETFPGLALVAWNGYLAPRGTPKDIIEKVSAAVVEASKTPEINKRLIELGMVPTATTPEEMAGMMRDDKTFYPGAIKAAGIVKE